MSDVAISEPNRWRLDTPGEQGWTHSARPGQERKYFMVSTDCHANEPADLWAKRIEPEYRARIPRVETDADGTRRLLLLPDQRLQLGILLMITRLILLRLLSEIDQLLTQSLDVFGKPSLLLKHVGT